jgi:alpha-L-fucosidase
VDLYNYVRSLQPKIIVNNRVGKARAGMEGMDQGAERVGDYGTPEQEIPPTGFGPGVDWESCMTMNNHWGYNKDDQHWKSTTTLVRNLIDCSSKGGNYLLNVGPTSEGLFPEASVERLAGIGRWMKVNHAAIYGTTASPFKRLPWGRCTTKTTTSGTTLYLHVFDWPGDGKLLVPGLKSRPVAAYLLADSNRKDLGPESTEEGLELKVPAEVPDKISSTVVLEFEGKPEVEATMLTQQADGSLRLPATEAILHGSQIKYESGANHDNLGYWTRPSDWAEWQFRVKEPGKFKVSAEIAALGSGRFEVVAGRHQLTGTAPTTGEYGRFEKVELGTVELTSPGPASMAVKPLKEGWQPMNLRAIELTPVK